MILNVLKIRTCAVWPFFGDYLAHNMDEVCEHIKKLCAEDGEKFIYAYHTQPDVDIHKFGMTSARVNEMLSDYNKQLEALANEVSDTLFLITSDHGMTSTTMKCVEDYPQIENALIRHICVEPRCCSFYVKDEKEFPRIFNETFPSKFSLFTHNEFLQSGLLGEGMFHPKVEDFVGDYVAVAVSDIALWYKDNNGEFNDIKDSHGGLTEEELTVPLIVIEK